MKQKIVFLVSSLFAMSLVSCQQETTKPSNEEEQSTYTITWVDENGDIIEVDNDVKYGEIPSFDGLTPTKESTQSEKYIFNGWTPAVKKVTKDQTYVASFINETKTYTVSWVNDDGTILAQNEVPYGSLPSYYEGTPTKEQNEVYHYEFDKWLPELTPVTGNTSYTASYIEKINTYTVTWTNYDGTVLKTLEDVPYGEIVHFDMKDPKREDDNGIKYDFNGWNIPEEEITEDTTYVATYTNQYEVDFNIPSSFKTTLENRYFDNGSMIEEPLAQHEIYDESNKKVIDGWYYDSSFSNLVIFPIKVNRPITLYPKIVSAATVSYTNGRNTITSINDKIESLTFDSSFATAIDSWAFTSRTKLKSLTVPSNFYGFTSGNLNTTVTKLYIKGGNSSFAPNNLKCLDSLEEVTFIDGATSIGSYAFSNCSKLSKVTFNNSIRSISEYAFYNTKLKEIELPNSLTTIESYAFKNTLIEEVQIPSSVTSIGSYAFDSELSKIFYLESDYQTGFNEYWNKNQFAVENRVILNYAGMLFTKDNFRFALVNSKDNIYTDELVLVKYLEPKNAPSTYSLTIPSSVDGFTVKGISDYAFLNNTKLESINVPSGIKHIGEGAFMGCTNLTSVYSQGGVLKSLGAKAFKDCTSLEFMGLAIRFEEIQDETFRNCEKLTGIYDYFESSIKSIGDYAFAGTAITSFDGFTSLNHIGEGAFYGCKELSSAVLSDTVSTIKANAFYGTDLKYVKCEFNSTQATIDYNGNVEFLFNYVGSTTYDNLTYIIINENGSRKAYLEKCEANYTSSDVYLYSINYDYYYGIPVTRILTNAFKDNTVVTSVRGSSVDTIDDYAFTDSNITSISFRNAKSIDRYALSGADSLNDVTLNGDSISGKSFSNTSIFGSSSENGVSLKLANSSITKINKGMFRNNTNITSIDLSECNNLTEIEEEAFKGCTNLTTVTLPYTLTTIGRYAFSGATKLTNVNFSSLSSLKSIGSYAFENCGGTDGFETIDLSISSTLSISSRAFKGVKIKNLKLPSSSVTLEVNTFDSSNKFESVEAPTSLFRSVSVDVNTIMQAGIKSAKKLKLTGAEEVLGRYSFTPISDIEEIDLSSSSIKTIKDQAFANLAVTKITLPTTLENIGTESFYNCDKLTSLIIPANVLKIDSNAFKNCPLLHLYLDVTKEETSSWDTTWFGDILEENIHYKDTWTNGQNGPEVIA